MVWKVPNPAGRVVNVNARWGREVLRARRAEAAAYWWGRVVSLWVQWC